MQYMIKNAKSDKTKQLMTELKDLNQVRSNIFQSSCSSNITLLVNMNIFKNLVLSSSCLGLNPH